MEVLTVIFIFIAVILLIEGVFLAARSWWNPEVKRVKKQLRRLAADPYQQGSDIALVRSRAMSDIPWFNRILLNLRTPLMDRFDRMVVQADLQYPTGVYILASIFLFAIGFVTATFMTKWFLARLAGGLMLVSIPFLYVVWKKRKRVRRFETQLPEAMDMLARSLKAGHAFTGGLQMVGQEFPDPLGTEFSKTIDEINFGVGYEEALKNLSSRIESDDLKLFVISVIIQRESGGNLSEILENIGHLIRERFKLKGHVRTLSAEARVSAYILIALPFVVALAVYIMNPNYIMVLLTDPMGHIMLLTAGLMMLVGIIIMKKMVTIKV
jgi:tight adherence protein B